MRVVLLLAVLAGFGCLALPVAALLLDGSDNGERLIIPLQVLLTAGIGALLAGPVLDGDARTARSALLGAALGLAGAALAVGVFLVLLGGL